MQHKFSVSSHLFREVVHAAKKNGYAIDPYYLHISCSESRIPLHDLCQLLNQLHQRSGDPDIGFRIGQIIQPACFNILGHLVMACNTVGEALPLVQKFQRLVIDCADVSCRIVNNCIVFNWTPVTQLYRSERALIDLVLSATRAFAVWATGVHQSVLEVEFQYRRPRDTAMCEKIFGHKGNYRRDVNGFRIPASWQNQPIRTASSDVKPLIHHHATHLLENLQSTQEVVGHVVEVLLKLLPQGCYSLERVANVMNISTRTLQRNLHLQATSFSAVLQRVRYRQADYFIKNTDLNLNEIAARLGYKEQSSFSSAYKNWAGITPSQARVCVERRQ